MSRLLIHQVRLRFTDGEFGRVLLQSWICHYFFLFLFFFFLFFFQAEDGIRDVAVTGVQTCALPIYRQTQAWSPQDCKQTKYTLSLDKNTPNTYIHTHSHTHSLSLTHTHTLSQIGRASCRERV